MFLYDYHYHKIVFEYSDSTIDKCMITGKDGG